MTTAIEHNEALIRERLIARDFDGATTLALKAYGSEIVGFLVATERDETAGAEVFSEFCEDLWRGIEGFRGQSSFRTWAYSLARNAAHRRRRDPFIKRGVPLAKAPEIFELADKIRTTTLMHLRTEVRDAVTKLRDRLDEADRELLVLRVNRKMSWAEIAEIVEGDDASEAERKRRAAALRKRYERVKERLKVMAREEGLLKSRRCE